VHGARHQHRTRVVRLHADERTGSSFAYLDHPGYTRTHATNSRIDSVTSGARRRRRGFLPSAGIAAGALASLPPAMGSLIKKRRKRMRKKKHKKLLKATRWKRRAAGK